MRILIHTMEEDYYLLLGDVINSRKIKDREEFQDKLIESLDRINQKFQDDIYADFKILKGIDEFGGVLKKPSNAYEIIKELHENILPKKVRYVLTKGVIDVALGKKDVEYMDGPVFHQANELMSELKRSKFYFELKINDYLMEQALFGQINALMILKNEWTQKQLLVIKKYKELGSQKKVANEMGITPQAISKNLDRSNYKKIKHIEKRLNLQFKELEGKNLRGGNN